MLDDVVVDSFAGCVLHFYSFNYDMSFRLWKHSANNERIRQALQRLWER